MLLDMILNRIAKGVKEVNVAATLEHIRDQRCNVVKNEVNRIKLQVDFVVQTIFLQEQFEFVLAAVAEEITAFLSS